MIAEVMMYSEGIYATEDMTMQAGWPSARSVYAATNSLSIAAGRISYILGMQGPCITTETACSASLVALHVAMRAQHALDPATSSQTRALPTPRR